MSQTLKIATCQGLHPYVVSIASKIIWLLEDLIVAQHAHLAKKNLKKKQFQVMLNSTI